MCHEGTFIRIGSTEVSDVTRNLNVIEIFLITLGIVSINFCAVRTMHIRTDLKVVVDMNRVLLVCRVQIIFQSGKDC